ncbi:DEAD/DEAH box helicase [Spiribacter halobius]|uniref:DEAD/DEAH box helicase n=1 Tax=Sediminicurvatus halobius TaxID=2182432 RepID=UPI001E469599|nr:DEAD/DEAH box helicase [Spiribacter halobius]UEX77450.1 DEAD/DEAH box helicase [Spiribacter halobius]
MSDALQRWLNDYGEHVIWADFDPQYLERGLRYAEEDRVLDIDPAGDGFFARVHGSGRNVYRVHVRINPPPSRRPVTIDCSCPLGGDCKHGIAALIRFLEAPREGTHNGVSPATRLWLQDIGATLEAQDEARRPAETLLYVLDVRPGAALEVSVWKGRRRKDGSLGRLSPYAGDGATGARFLTPGDRRVLPLLPNGKGPVDPVQVPVVLRELAELGRAHWGSAGGTVLSPGPTRRGALRWQVLEDGSQRLVADAAGEDDEPLVALRGEPPWYVATASGEAGPLELGLPARTASTLLAAPPVAAAEVADVAGALRRLGDVVPLPEPPPRREIKDVTPVPCLVLEQDRLVSDEYWGDGFDEPEPVARLAFDYDGVTLPPGGQQERARQVSEGALVEVLRDRAAEQAAAERLRGFGLTEPPSVEAGRYVPGRGTDWLEVITRAVPELEAAGWRVETTAAFPWRLVEPDDWYADLDAESGNAWFELELGVEVEGERHSLLPLLMQLIRRQPQAMSQRHLDAVDPEASLLLDLGDGRLLPVPAARFVPILRTLSELYDPQADAEDGRLRLPALRAGALEALEAGAPLRWEGDEALRELGQRIAALGRIEPAEAPAGLQGALRGYQREGLGWLQALAAQGLGGVLADDMGLGKTIQVLAHLLREKEAGRAADPSLVVAPTSLLFNWEREAERFAPGLRVLRLHGSDRHRRREPLGAYDLVLTTYALAHRDVEALAAQPWHLCVLDEAQAVKNPRAKAARAVRQLRARQRLCLTGTPLENHLGELWTQFDFVLPGLLGDQDSFNRVFRRPVERDGDSGRQRGLRQRISPFLLRRTKQAIARELPPKTEMQRHAELTGAQRDLYETVRVAMDQRVRQEIARRGLGQSQVVVLDALLKLRQVCCDPRLLKMDAARGVERSAKLELLMDLLPELIEEGRRVLLFSQFTSMLALIEQALAGTGIDYAMLTGQTRDREAQVARFQSGAVPLFLVSLKAGGTGLNLTAADTVIHYDPWWNPAVMRQATDRAHRIGQAQPVFVYHLLTRNTVEEKIMALQQRKAELGDALLGGEQGSTAALEMADVEQLFAPLR